MSADPKDTKGKVHAIGSAEAILPFRAGGVVLHPTLTAEETGRALEEANAQPPGSLILITEEAASSVPAELKEMEEAGKHAFLVIPTKAKEKSLGMETMRAAIIHSVGVDLMSRSSARVAEEIAVEET